MVAWIDRHKYDLLALAVVTAVALALTAGFFAVPEHEGGQMTKHVADIGGYVAIAGLVLGLPALIYAMVTGSTVERIWEKMGSPKDKVDHTEKALKEELKDFEAGLPPKHFLQVFAPERWREQLVPIYDPKSRGPGGWSIDPATPQAITGSAWVGRTYLWGKGEELKQAKLRLTPEQVRRYADLEAVAAAPIFDEKRKVPPPDDPGGEPVADVVGVLTVCSTVASSKIGDKGFEKEHQEAADSLASALEPQVPAAGALTQNDLSK